MATRSRPRIDFDGEPKKLIQEAYAAAEDVQRPRFEQYERDWLLYLAYIDMADRDPDFPNVSLPKLYSILETKTPDDIDALFGRRPYLPCESKRKEFRVTTDVITNCIDELLFKAGMYEEGTLLTKLKTLYGTAYQSIVPYYEKIEKRSIIVGPDGSYHPQTEEAYRLRFMLETWAPWEVMVAPMATTLSKKTGCRYVVKIQLASKREIKTMAAQGMYPDLDVDRLDAYVGSTTSYRGAHRGLTMLERYGLPSPTGDDDIGVLLRYESPDRHVDAWMGELVIRDKDNDFKHGMINLSRIIHVMAPHTQHRFFGIGEAKPNEVQIAMLNDTWNLTMAAHGMMGQPMIFFRKNKIAKKDIVFAIGQRVAVKGDSDRPIGDDILIHGGQPLPRDHYIIPDKLERNIDMTSGDFGPARGEPLQGGSDTASEAIIAVEKGGKRREAGIKLAEYQYKADLFVKAASHFDQFSNMSDVAETVGFEQAVLAQGTNPAELPGGYNLNYQGSARVLQLGAKQQALEKYGSFIAGSIAARPGALERKMLRLSDFDEEEVNEIILTPEELDQKIRQDAMMEIIQGAMQSQGSENGKGAGGKASPKKAKQAANA